MAPDRNLESRAAPGVLRPDEPAGSRVELNDDGTATFVFKEDPKEDVDDDFTANLADGMDDIALAAIARDLIDAIKIDKQSRERRDKQYEEGLRRTGLGDDAPGGAPFPGASKTVHPMLVEATIDYAGRVQAELLPPSGPCKARIIGTPTNAKDDRAERTARYINWQMTVGMPAAYTEFEIGFSQEPLSGVYYSKLYTRNGRTDVMVVHADQVYRPWADGDFYSLPRITHSMEVSRFEFEDNVRRGIWLDVVDVKSAPAFIEQSTSSSSNDRIIGRDQPEQNIDDIRPVYEVSTELALDGPDDDVLPYLVTIDVQSEKILSIYRNWDEEDPRQQRLDFLIEWPFQPWRGMPIGLAHMIGGLSGAATGSLRALLDAGFLNATQTGVRLKGGITAGGQNVRAQPGSTIELQGSLAQDPDIRKTYMPLEFPPPSQTLFELLGFLQDAGRGVVRTTFDEFNKMSGEMPVGTANMMIEQGLKTFGAVFARQHRSMERFLRQLWYFNSKTVDDEQIIDSFGELIVTKEDFAGPICVEPVSDPRIFTDTQRLAQAQLITSRAQAYIAAGIPMYNARQAELNILKAAKVAQPEQYLIPQPEPTQLNAANENAAVTQGQPIKAFPGQDHEAHIAVHCAFIQSPVFGSNPILAMQVLPALLKHLSEHIGLWYADATRLAVDAVLQDTFQEKDITLEALQTVQGLEVQLDRLIAEVTPAVMQHADAEIKPILEIISKAQAQLKAMQPPQPQDPSVVAAEDVKRQEKADEQTAQLKAKELETRQQSEAARIEQQRQSDERKDALAQQKASEDAALKRQELEQRAESEERNALIAAAGVAAQREGQNVTLQATDINSQTQLEIAEGKNETQLEVAKVGAESSEKVAKMKPKPKPAGKS